VSPVSFFDSGLLITSRSAGSLTGSRRGGCQQCCLQAAPAHTPSALAAQHASGRWWGGCKGWSLSLWASFTHLAWAWTRLCMPLDNQGDLINAAQLSLPQAGPDCGAALPRRIPL
jgi:hypothetical protein